MCFSVKMHFEGEIVLLLVFQYLGSIHYGHANFEGQECAERRVWHHRKDGTYVCCQPKNCPEGEFVRLCNHWDKSSNITCERCENGTFRATSTSSLSGIYNCEAHRECPKELGMFEKTAPSRFRNRQCQCLLSEGYFDPDFSVDDERRPYFCIQKECGPGLELSANGSCTLCPANTFKGTGYGRCVTRESKGKPLRYLLGTVAAVFIITVTIGIVLLVRRKHHRRILGSEDMEMNRRELQQSVVVSNVSVIEENNLE